MNTDEIFEKVDARFDHWLSELTDLVAIPSVSSSAFDQSTLERSAQWILEHAQALGLEGEVVHHVTDDGIHGRPAVLASRPAEEGKPTIMLYAHHDVQPQGSEDLWETKPFEATRKGDRLYGRGAADDKAGVVLHLAAIEAANPGVGIVLFVEGEEEVGSPSFASFLEAYRDRLAADVIVVADSNNWEVGTPSLTTSLRGVAQLEIELKVLDHAVHSGMYSGPVLDAVTLAARMIATLHDENGDVAVAGLHSSPAPDVEYPEEQLRRDMGLLEGVEFSGTGSLTERLWKKPTITLIGMDVTPSDLASNTLIPSTRFKLSLRVAPAQDPREAAEALAEHLRANVPFGAQATVEITETGPGFEAGEDTEITKMEKWALEAAFEKEPVDIGVGGSIPFISDLGRVFPQAQVLVTGVEDPDSRAHSQNESLHLGDWLKAIRAEALMLSKLGE